LLHAGAGARIGVATDAGTNRRVRADGLSLEVEIRRDVVQRLLRELALVGEEPIVRLPEPPGLLRGDRELRGGEGELVWLAEEGSMGEAEAVRKLRREPRELRRRACREG